MEGSAGAMVEAIHDADGLIALKRSERQTPDLNAAESKTLSRLIPKKYPLW